MQDNIHETIFDTHQWDHSNPTSPDSSVTNCVLPNQRPVQQQQQIQNLTPYLGAQFAAAPDVCNNLQQTQIYYTTTTTTHSRTTAQSSLETAAGGFQHQPSQQSCEFPINQTYQQQQQQQLQPQPHHQHFTSLYPPSHDCTHTNQHNVLPTTTTTAAPATVANGLAVSPQLIQYIGDNQHHSTYQYDPTSQQHFAATYFECPSMKPTMTIRSSKRMNPIRKSRHNEVERRRRSRIKESCDALSLLVPGVSEKSDKAMILEQTVRFIEHIGTCQLAVKCDCRLVIPSEDSESSASFRSARSENTCDQKPN